MNATGSPVRTKRGGAVKEFEGSDALIDLKHGDASFADEINARHNKIVAHGKAAFAEAIRIGELLVVNKKAVRHGDWLRWIDKNLEFDCRQAQKYMSIYERRDELRALANTNSEFAFESINGCLLLLKKTDREATANGEQPAAVATDSESKPAVAEPKQKPKSADDDQIPTEPEETGEACWRRGLLERAQKATRGAAFEDWWTKYTFDAEVINAATEAATAWQNLVTFLNRFPF